MIVVYLISLTFLCLYSLGQLDLTIKYMKNRRRHSNTNTLKPLQHFPAVTVQLPIYNERFVVERLIDACCAMNYPKDRLEIQILDDSNDDTSDIIKKKIAHYAPRGIKLMHIQRPDRVGFKAGALAHGMSLAMGDFIAIFDADFVPHNDFLLDTIPHFKDKEIGMVQTRWGHINRNYSIFTKMQAFGLNAHFSIEQSARNDLHSFINFNGTAGIWRKSCIQEAGGWSADTLTEDLDLSYRAQLKGWKFKYLEEVETPAELPILMPAIKSQQYRWNKGAAETSVKNLRRVYQQALPLRTKIHATFHLLNSSVFLILLIASVLSLPLLVIKSMHPNLLILFHIANIFLIGFFSIGIYFYVASKRSRYTTIKESFFTYFVTFMMISMGMSLHNGLAVLEGFIGKKTPFVRTPKFGSTDTSGLSAKNAYLNFKFSPLSIVEGILGLYFLAGIGLGIYLHDFGLVVFHAMLAVGFLTISYQSVKNPVHAT